MKKLIPTVVACVAVLCASLAHAGSVVNLGVSSTSATALTNYSTTIDFQYECYSWTSGGTLQLYIMGGTPVDIGAPQTIPNIAATSYQFSGSVSVTFAAAGVYQVSARVTGTDASGTSICNRSTVSVGTPVTITVSDPTFSSESTTTSIQAGIPGRLGNTGADSLNLAFGALALIVVGVAISARRRLF